MIFHGNDIPGMRQIKPSLRCQSSRTMYLPCSNKSNASSNFITYFSLSVSMYFYNYLYGNTVNWHDVPVKTGLYHCVPFEPTAAITSVANTLKPWLWM